MKQLWVLKNNDVIVWQFKIMYEYNFIFKSIIIDNLQIICIFYYLNVK